jgi:hypothetical protein
MSFKAQVKNRTSVRARRAAKPAKGLARECALDLTANNVCTNVTIEFSGKVETHKADNDADKGKNPCRDIHDKRPSPWSPSGVDLPLEIEGGDKLPSIPISRDLSDVGKAYK